MSGNSSIYCNFLVPAEALEVPVCGMGNRKMESTEAQDLSLIERNYWSILEISSIQEVSPKALPGQNHPHVLLKNQGVVLKDRSCISVPFNPVTKRKEMKPKFCL